MLYKFPDNIYVEIDKAVVVELACMKCKSLEHLTVLIKDDILTLTHTKKLKTALKRLRKQYPSQSDLSIIKTIMLKDPDFNCNKLINTLCLNGDIEEIYFSEYLKILSKS